jgi:uncharacterized protein (DUF1778 family)
MATTTAKRARKDDVIQIRASGETKALLQRAAAMRGQKLSEFVLSSAREEAEHAILDQRLFVLSPEDHEKFLKMLDEPFKPSAKAIERMNRDITRPR